MVTILIRFHWVLVLGLFFSSSSGCAQQPAQGMIIQAGEFKEKLEKDSGIVLDVRTQGEFNNGHVAGALLLDIMKPDFGDQIKKLDKEKTYYVYCRSGNRSTKATALMNELGFKKVYNVKDGIDNILKSGVPVAKE